jgi:hypothetical protein
MKETDLAIFYNVGKCSLGMNLLELMRPSLADPVRLLDAVKLLNGPDLWLKDFLTETEGMEMSDSRAAAKTLRVTIVGLFGDLAAALEVDVKNARDAVVGSATIARFQAELQRFEEAFTRDSKQLDVFTVTRKGLYSTRALIERPETKFPANLLAVMPQKTIQDLQEAGRCLAFERPTACAFHICRATEALMLAYYEKLAKKPWPFAKRDWNIFNDHLTKEGAPKGITNRLAEIREDRNAYAHPDVTVPLDEGPIVYDLCTGVMFYMAKEMETVP